jgi:hypothetical protein
MLSRFATLGGGVATDPYWNNVSYLLVGNGANGTTTNIKDSSKNNLTTTIIGNTATSTAQNKYGSGSVYFDGSGDYLTLPSTALLNFGTGDFTIEAWVQLPSSANVSYILCGFGTPNNYVAVYKINATTYVLEYYDEHHDVLSTTTFGLNTFVYLTVVRSSNTVTLYVNGIGSSATNTGSITWGTSSTPLYIGSSPAYAGSYEWRGYIYDLRITKGVARYTSNFTPPTAPLPIG